MMLQIANYDTLGFYEDEQKRELVERSSMSLEMLQCTLLDQVTLFDVNGFLILSGVSKIVCV